MKAIKFFMAAAVAAVLAVSCGQTGVKVDAPKPTKGEIDTVSYFIGINFGSFIKNYGFAKDLKDLNLAEIKKGMEDLIEAEITNPYDTAFAKQFKLDPNTMGEVLDAYLRKMSEYETAVALAEGEEFLTKNALKENVDETASGLQYTIDAPGADYKIQPVDTVVVNYKGALIDGTVFDEGSEVEFVVNQVIKGWTEGLGLIGEGGKIKLYIPSELGYGSRATGKIPANSVLIFDVEVLEVNKNVPAEEVEE